MPKTQSEREAITRRLKARQMTTQEIGQGRVSRLDKKPVKRGASRTEMDTPRG